jgi:hypothetical protein
MQHPEVEAKLVAEVLGVMGPDTQPSYQQLSDMRYLNAVLKVRENGGACRCWLQVQTANNARHEAGRGPEGGLWPQLRKPLSSKVAVALCTPLLASDTPTLFCCFAARPCGCRSRCVCGHLSGCWLVLGPRARHLQGACLNQHRFHQHCSPSAGSC